MPDTNMIEIDGEFVHYAVSIDKVHSTITVSLPDYPQYSSSTYYYRSYKQSAIESMVRSLYELAKD